MNKIPIDLISSKKSKKKGRFLRAVGSFRVTARELHKLHAGVRGQQGELAPDTKHLHPSQPARCSGESSTLHTAKSLKEHTLMCPKRTILSKVHGSPQAASSRNCLMQRPWSWFQAITELNAASRGDTSVYAHSCVSSRYPQTVPRAALIEATWNNPQQSRAAAPSDGNGTGSCWTHPTAPTLCWRRTSSDAGTRGWCHPVRQPVLVQQGMQNGWKMPLAGNV